MRPAFCALALAAVPSVTAGLFAGGAGFGTSFIEGSGSRGDLKRGDCELERRGRIAVSWVLAQRWRIRQERAWYGRLPPSCDPALGICGSCDVVEAGHSRFGTNLQPLA